MMRLLGLGSEHDWRVDASLYQFLGSAVQGFLMREDSDFSAAD